MSRLCHSDIYVMAFGYCSARDASTGHGARCSRGTARPRPAVWIALDCRTVLSGNTFRRDHMKTALSLKRVMRASVAVGAAGALVFGGLTACSSDDDDSDSASNPAGKTTELPSNPATGDPIKIGFIASRAGGADADAAYLG